MFNRPYDIAVMAALFAAVFVTIGFGIQAAIEGGATIDADTSGFLNSTNSRITDPDFLAGSSTSASEAIVGSEGASAESSSITSLVLKGLSSLLSLGKTYAYVQDSLLGAQSIVGIPPVYVTLVLFVLIITLMVIIYTWARGSA